MLEKKDFETAARIDQKNSRRLIRALEIIYATKKPITTLQKSPPYRVLFLGIKLSREQLRNNIRSAIAKRLNHGLIEETRILSQKYSYQTLAERGLDYEIVQMFIAKKINRKELIERLEAKNWQYAKRQMTWLKRYSDVHWVKSELEATRLIKRFLKDSKIIS